MLEMCSSIPCPGMARSLALARLTGVIVICQVGGATRTGIGNPLWTTAPAHRPLDAAVFPDELRDNTCFTRRGNAFSRGFHAFGDFDSLKGIATDLTANGLEPVHNILIRSYQYI